MMTHHTSKAGLEKGSSWPLKAFPYGVPLRVDLLVGRLTSRVDLLMVRTHILDLTLGAPRPYVPFPIQLLLKLRIHTILRPF